MDSCAVQGKVVVWKVKGVRRTWRSIVKVKGGWRLKADLWW